MLFKGDLLYVGVTLLIGKFSLQSVNHYQLMQFHYFGYEKGVCI